MCTFQARAKYRKYSPGKGSDTDGGGYSQPSDGGAGGGYMDQLKGKKKETNYKQYTLRDYKSLKTDIRLGGLGPNLENETVKEKVRVRVF